VDPRHSKLGLIQRAATVSSTLAKTYNTVSHIHRSGSFAIVASWPAAVVFEQKKKGHRERDAAREVPPVCKPRYDNPKIVQNVPTLIKRQAPHKLCFPSVLTCIDTVQRRQLEKFLVRTAVFDSASHIYKWSDVVSQSTHPTPRPLLESRRTIGSGIIKRGEF
jgi:hypothetical protein